MDLGAATGGRIQFNAAARQRGALLHAPQPEPRSAHRFSPQPVHVKPNAVIADGQVEVAILPAELDLDGVGPGMTHDVRQSLLGDSETFRLDYRVEPFLDLGRAKFGLHTGQRRLPVSVPA